MKPIGNEDPLHQIQNPNYMKPLLVLLEDLVSQQTEQTKRLQKVVELLRGVDRVDQNTSSTLQDMC